MVKLFNIKKADSLISCNYSPENSNLIGFVEFDCTSEEIKQLMYSAYEYGKKMYVAQTIAKLIELSKNDSIPNEAVAIWY